MTVPNTAATAIPKNIKNIIIKNCTPFINCISEINNTQIDNAKDSGIVMLMHNLKELQNCNRKLFWCPPQKWAEMQPTF